MKKSQSLRRSIRSTGVESAFHWSETVYKKDKRPTVGVGFGKQGAVICPECQTITKAKRATREECGLYGRISGIRKGDLIVGKHRVGGGTVSIMRGDVVCKGFGLPISKDE